MKIQRRGFLGGLVTLPFVGKALAAEAVKPAKLLDVGGLTCSKPFDLQAAKRAWREYVRQLQLIATNSLWRGKTLEDAMADVEAYKKLNPPPPYAKPKDYMAAMERLDATL